jgi:hypothetical protein
VIKDIRRATRRHFSAEDKIRIVLEGLRGEDRIAEDGQSASQSDRQECALGRPSLGGGRTAGLGHLEP